MTQPDNIQIVRHIFEAWNKHDVERYGKLLDEKHVVESDTLPAPLHQADESAHRDPRLLRWTNQRRPMMPVYEYYCENCRKAVAVPLSIGEHDKGVPACPQCNGKDVCPLMSTFFSQTSRTS